MKTDKVKNAEMINALKFELEKVFQHPMHLPRDVDMLSDQMEVYLPHTYCCGMLNGNHFQVISDDKNS